MGLPLDAIKNGATHVLVAEHVRERGHATVRLGKQTMEPDGAIGRLVAEDVAGLIRYVRGQ
jgi:hypothetical protein